MRFEIWHTATPFRGGIKEAQRVAVLEPDISANIHYGDNKAISINETHRICKWATTSSQFHVWHETGNRSGLVWLHDGKTNSYWKLTPCFSGYSCRDTGWDGHNQTTTEGDYIINPDGTKTLFPTTNPKEVNNETY